nr:Chain A, IILKEK Peptide [synthetic construct]7Q8J_PA Chain PA, IILKEK Peptide [synthetic construct]
IILKEK